MNIGISHPEQKNEPVLNEKNQNFCNTTNTCILHFWGQLATIHTHIHRARTGTSVVQKHLL